MAMTLSRLHAVYELGQSIWYDNIRRSVITSGELRRLMDQDAVVGVTSNPTIFEKAIDGSTDYDAAIKSLVSRGVTEGKAVFEALAIEDIQAAADILRPIYDRTHGHDGFISLEVSPGAAHSTRETIAEARRLWQRVNRPNAMIKIPATAEGIPAIEHMIYEGVNINVTLIFALDVYAKVAQAYIRGLELRQQEGQPLEGVASVASFFVSRVDTVVDALLRANLGRRRTRSSRRSCAPSRARPPSPTPSWPTPPTKISFAVSASSGCAPLGRLRSAVCGLARAQRTLITPM